MARKSYITQYSFAPDEGYYTMKFFSSLQDAETYKNKNEK